jgi:hypothetical protein
VLEAFVANLGKYNEGDLCGEYLKLPATKEDVQALLSRIGVDGVLYRGFFITDYETDIDGLHGRLSKHASLDELNYLASLLEEMDEWDIEKFQAAVELGGNGGSLKALINLAQNLDSYYYLPGIMDAGDLGYYYANDLLTPEITGNNKTYKDYAAYGHDIKLGNGGIFSNCGYIYRNGGSFAEHYNGRDIPDEYKIFAFPGPPGKMPVKAQLEMFGKMASSHKITGRAVPARLDRA